MKTFTTRLVEWYEENGRDLPWRENPSPYSIWVSEVMLQQTTVPAVIERYRRWMERFPDIPALAAASERNVLSEWEGMGYYQRASRMREAAGIIVQHHDGRLPSDEQSLLKLPGIGPYIASAIRSLAFGADVVAVDANVNRVFMRQLALKGPVDGSQTRRHILRVAGRMLPSGDSSRFNQALMDFGSLICRPNNPECSRCFASEFCRAFDKELQHEIPPGRRKTLEKIETAVAVFLNGSEVYIQQRPSGGLFGGMWEFPGGKLRHGETPEDAVVREVKEELATQCAVTAKVTSFVHFYTRFRVTLHAFLCSAGEDLPLDNKRQWVELVNVSGYPMPAANRKLIRHLREMMMKNSKSEDQYEKQRLTEANTGSRRL